MEAEMSRQQIEAAKNLVWQRFVVNVSREEDPVKELALHGYRGISVPVILRAAKLYRQTGQVLK